MRLAITFASFLLAIATSAQEAAPQPTPPELPASTPMGVVVVRSKVGRERAGLTRELHCTEVPETLFRKDERIFPKGLPPGSRIAGNGRTLGILVPELPRWYQLTLVRKGRVINELRLRAPDMLPFGGSGSPKLVLGDDGDVAALEGRDAFAVYADGTLTGVFSGENAQSAKLAFSRGLLYWCPLPRSAPTKPRAPTTALFEAGEEPPLWLRAELDGSREKVLLRLDTARLDEKDPNPAERTLAVAPRSDGRLWLVGLGSGEIMLTSKGDGIAERWTLPYLLKTPENDPQSVAKVETDARKELEEFVARHVSDATKRPPRSAEIVVHAAFRLFADVLARDRDLVLTTMTVEPSNALLLIRNGERDAHCFTFPRAFRSTTGMLPVAVTDDELWFFQPFGSFAWTELEALLAEQEEKPPGGEK